MTATVVIGAGYGDEGKGLITDFEVRRLQATTVCRFNGGAQAGHTVHAGGKRHVFGHLGAGTFAGASTYLGSRFIVNPLVLDKERGKLLELGIVGLKITSHRRARVTTIYDMMVNALLEEKRGIDRHGSCGLGINETVTRHEIHPLTIGDIWSLPFRELVNIIDDIKGEWLPGRLAFHGITDISEQYAAGLAQHPVKVAEGLCYAAGDIQERKTTDGPIVFEGAQGLMLDEFLGRFPHVTRSMTGLPYAIISANELGVKSLQPTYATRAYSTRHGNGHLDFEGISFGAAPADATNVPNHWQGTLRYAPLNIQAISAFITEDYQRGKVLAQAHGVELKLPTIALTCLDQLGDTVTVINRQGRLLDITSTYLPQFLYMELGIHVSHMSRGPTATDVTYRPAE